MRLNESLDRFESVVSRAGLIAVRKKYKSETLEELRDVFTEQDLKDIASFGYPAGFRVPLVAEDLEIYDLEVLISRQKGYRTDALSGAVADNWPEDFYVFADASANPFAIDSRGGIHFARHGMGNWRFEKIASELSIFFDIISEWISFFVIDNNSNILDDNFEVTPLKKRELIDSVPQGLSEIEKSTFIKALGI